MYNTVSERGQSELLGFLLIFTVVVLTIAIVGMTGFVGLDNARDFQRTSNAEQGFFALSDNIDDVIRGGVPSRVTEIRIVDASLAVQQQETTITLNYEDGSERNTTVETHPIVYDSGTDTTLTYRNGAVIRRDGVSGVLLREPALVVTPEQVIIPVIDTSLDNGGRIGGETAVSVKTKSRGTQVFAAGESVENITLNISSTNAAVWKRYFDQLDDGGTVTAVTQDHKTVEVTIQSDQVYVTIHQVAIAFH